ncbi:DUF396-domain-containing protein [Auriscalpium vulgare]|uniref:DUF396-domain-containing protein n=1 Tax=Auriscalpium vulgare TaxID=40419 RepID=A0ACB8REF0_9AGAM|nr:DUF396-domain-containing protein [Auriscalpium vulgare]
MNLLHLLSYAAAIVAFMFVTLSLASGLLWLSEVIEEHSRSAKTIGKRGIYAIIALHVLLYITDSLPLSRVAFSIFCHVVYLQNFSQTWPFISLLSPSFVASCVLVVADHFIWFFYFAQLTHLARNTPRRGPRATIAPEPPTFGDMATFFGVCVWLAPLFLFLSLSANDHALPTATGVPDSAAPSSTPRIAPAPRARASLFRSLFDSLPLDYLPRIRPKRSQSEGIIAPRSPGPIPPPSPTHSLNNIPRPRTPSYGDFQDATSRNLTADFSLLSPPPRRSASGPSVGTSPPSPSISRRRL